MTCIEIDVLCFTVFSLSWWSTFTHSLGWSGRTIIYTSLTFYSGYHIRKNPPNDLSFLKNWLSILSSPTLTEEHKNLGHRILVHCWFSCAQEA